MSITVNQADQLFVIKSGGGYSCLGFKVVYDRARELAHRLALAGKKLLEPTESEIGTVAQFEQYQALLSAYDRIHDNKTWFDADTPESLIRVLERARKSHAQIRVFYGDAITGRDWLEESEVIGTVGRSCGPMKVPLLVEKGADGGPALLTKAIVRIVDVTAGRELYRHANYQAPRLRVEEIVPPIEGLTHAVLVCDEKDNWTTQARFKSMAKAAHWVAFMLGDSFDFR